MDLFSPRPTALFSYDLLSIDEDEWNSVQNSKRYINLISDCSWDFSLPFCVIISGLFSEDI